MQGSSPNLYTTENLPVSENNLKFDLGGTFSTRETYPVIRSPVDPLNGGHLPKKSGVVGRGIPILLVFLPYSLRIMSLRQDVAGGKCAYL